MGGSIKAACDIAFCATSESITCTVVGTCPNEKELSYFKQEYPRVNFLGFPATGLRKKSFYSKELISWLRSNIKVYDIVHSHGLFNFPYLFGAYFAIKNKRELVLSPHNSLDPYDLKKKGFIKKYLFGPLIVKRIIENTRSILCTVPLEAERLVTYTNKKIEKRVIPLPVKLPEPTSAIDIYQEFDLHKADKHILFLARIDRKKGIEYLIESLNQLNRKDIKLIIAGTGDNEYIEELKSLIDRYNLTDQIKWVGFISGELKISTYQQCDIFALTSKNENFGITIVEAMYYGAPLLLSKGVYLYPLVEEHNAGYICDVSTESASIALKEMLTDEAEVALRAKNAKELSKTFQIDSLRSQYSDLYDKLERE